MTTEKSIDNETWSTLTEQTILLQDGLKFVADLVSVPEFDSNSLSIFVDCEFRFERSWIAKLAQRLQAALCMKNSPYQLFFDFRQRTIIGLWLSQRKRLKACKYGEGKEEASKTTVEKRKPVSFSSHVSLLLLLPLLESQSKIDPSLPISCTEVLLHCLRECTPYSLCLEPRSSLDGLERLLCSWLTTETSKQSQSAEGQVSTSRKEDIVAALIALACGRLSIRSLIQVILILEKHKTSLHNISTHQVLQRTLAYTRTGKHTLPAVLKTSNFNSRWHCKPYHDLASNQSNDDKCASIASDGKFLYITCSTGKGLAKIGTGRMGTLRGLLYDLNSSIDLGWVAWNHGFLLFRPAAFDSNGNIFCFVLDPSTLKIKYNIEFKDPVRISNKHQVGQQVSTVQFTGDGFHLYWIFTLSKMTTDQPQESQLDQFAHDLCIWEFKLEEVKDTEAMSARTVAVPVTPQHMVIDLRRVDENYKSVHQSDATSAGQKQPAQTPNNIQFNISNFGLARSNLCKTPMFVASDMLILVLPHYSVTSAKGAMALRAKKNPINCCFSLVDDSCIIRENLIDSDDSSWLDFGIARLGVCCDPMDGVIWTYGENHVCEWSNTGFPCMNQVKDQLAVTNDPFGPSEGDQMDVTNILSSTAIQITMLSRTLDAQLSAHHQISPDSLTGALLDSSYLILIYEALHLGIVSKNHSIILSLLHVLQPLLQIAVTRRVKLENQVVKDLRSLVWMLVCASSESYSRQIQRQACKVFVRGLNVFYTGSKEQSALLMVLLSESDSASNGIYLMREMLLRDMAAKLADTEESVKPPNKLAYDAECKLIKNCVMESTTDILQCVSLTGDDLAEFLAVQPDVSASLQYISTLVMKIWRELLLSDDYQETSLAEVSGFISRNVESIMFANKMFEASHELLEVVLEALQKLQNDSSYEIVHTRLDGLEKVIRASPIGQLLLFLVTIMANAKFCNLPLAKGLLSRVTTTTITATKAANLFHHIRTAANTKPEVSVPMPTLQSSLPQLTPWTHSCTVESIHPVRDDYRYTKTVTFKGAKCLYLKFDPRCATQYEYDKVMVYAGPNTTAAKVGEFGGNAHGYGSKGVVRLGWPKDFITVEGDSVTFVFQVKSTRERTTPDKAVWGFACSVSIKKESSEDEDITLPVLTDYALGLSHLNYNLLGVLYDGPATINEEEACSHLLNSQLLQRCIWEKSEGVFLQETQASGIKITITHDEDQTPSTTPKALPRQTLSTELTAKLRNASGIRAPTIRPSIRQALEPETIEEVILSAVIRHLNLYDTVRGLELLKVANADSSEYVRLCEIMREVFRKIDGILRQLQAMAEVELRWSQEIEDLRQGLLQPSAAFFNEYHLQEVKSKDLELLCSLKGILFDPMEQEHVVGKLIELLENEAQSSTNHDSDDLLPRMPKTRALRHSIMECGELLCSVTIQSPFKKRGTPGRSVSHGSFLPRIPGHEHQVAETSSVNRSFSAPSQLHRSMSVREGAQDLRRLQRWRTAIQKKKQPHGLGIKPGAKENNMEFASILDDIFTFIGSDPDKEVSYSSFLSAARLRNERGLSRVQALLHMHELIGVCSSMPGYVPELMITIASVLSQGPRIEELKCGGMVTRVREEFTNVVQALLQQTSTDPIIYSNSILVLSVCPFSWQEERCVIRSGLISLLDKLCSLGRDQSQSSRNTASMAWASFQVLLDRFVQWENDIGYQAGEIEWSGLAYQVSSLITNYLDLVMEESRQESTKARDSLQYILKLLQSIAGSKMGEAILQQSCTVFTLFAVLLDPQAPPKLVLTVLKLCRAALPLMTTNSCEQLTLPVTAEQYLNRDGNATDLKPVLKVAKLLLVKLGGFISPCVQSGKRLQYGKNCGNGEKGNEESANGSEKTGQYIVYVHKRSEQPSHEVVQKIMSQTGQRFVFRAGLGTEIDRAVRLDHELTENNKAVIMTDVFNACVTKASSLAAIGLVTSVLPAYHRQQEPSDKGLVSSENVCSVRNQILASQSCRPFVSGQVAHTMASEVISLLQSLLTSPFSDTAFLWSSAVRQVLSDTLNSVPSLMGHLGEEIERLIMWQGQETEEDEDKLTVVNEELMMVSGQVMAALCTMGGFNHTVYAGCNAKIVGEDMVPMTCEVLSVSDGMATVLMNDTTREGSTQKDRKLELPLVRLELPHKEPVSLNKLELVEQAIEALHLILTTRDVTFPRMSESHDSNTLLLNTSAARVLCELKTRASMVLACQMKDPMFCNGYTSHPSRPLQTIKSLADMTDPGRRLPVLDSQCQELRKLFKDLVKPVHRRHHGKTKTVVLDIGKEHPPLKGVVFTEGYRVAHLLIEGENVPNMPRGAYLYATQSIPIKAPSYYWEVEVLSLGRRDAASYVGSGSSFSVGIAPTVSRPADKWATPVGACVLHDNGIAVHYRRGGFTNWETTNTGLVLKDSHVIGCSYTRSNDDVDYGSVYFTHNGQQLPGILHGVRAGLWPVVHLHRKDVKVRVNFGSQPFVYAKGSKIRQAADLASDSMEEVRQLLLELPFAGVENDSDEEAKVKPPSEGVAAAKIKKIPEPLSLSSDTDIREYDPSASLNCMLSSSCDVMTDTGPLSHMEEDDYQKKIVDSENASPTELLVKAWEEKVFPVIRRRFRNEADRRSGLDQIRGALQAGMMDIAVATLEDLYEDSGGIPNTLTLPRLEDVKEDANKLSARNIKQGMAVVVSSRLNDTSVAPEFAVPDVKRTYGLTGIVLTIDKPHNIAEVETYNREEGNLMRFWYPISALERPTSGLSRSSFLAMRAGDTTLTEALQELLTCEKEITRLYCQEALIEAMETSRSLQFDYPEDSEVTLLKSLSRHHLLGPYTDGSSAPTLNTVSSLRCCLSLGHVLPSVLFYTDPARIISKVNQLLNDKASSGEDEVIRLTDSVCHGFRDSSKLLWHREFVVSHEALEEEIHFPQAAITVLTCRSNPLIHTGWMNGKKPFVTVLCYYGGAKLSKTGKVAKYKAVQYPSVADENTNYWAEKYPVKILATNRVVVRYEDHATEGPVVDLYALSPDLLLGLVFIETFVQHVSNRLDCEDFTNQTNELTENTLMSKTVIFNVIELVSTFLLRTKLPSVVKEVVFHLLAQLLRISHRVESMTSSFPSQAHTSQLTLILTRLMPLKTELQKLLDKEVSATNEVALEFILRGDFENNKFVSYLQALFEVVLAMAEVTPLTRDQGGYRRSRQGSLTDGMLQGDSAQNSPSSTASSPFDFKPEDSTTSASVTGSGTTVIPQTPPWSSRARRKGSLRRRKRAHVHEVVSPTESMPWFDNVLASILVLRHLIQGNEARSVHALYDSLSSVVAIKASVTQRLLVITNIPKTMSKDEAIIAIEKACRPCGGIFKECTYLPEIRYQDSNSHAQQDNGGEGLHHLTKLLPSAQSHKPDKIFGYAVVELRNSSQTDLARQAISSSKSFKESSTSREDPIGVAKVITDLLMDGTNELEAFAVFDEFLERKLYDDANQLKASALDVLGEIFRSCGTSVVLSDFDRDTPPRPLSRRGSVLMTRLHLSGTKSPDIQEREERTSSSVALLEKHEDVTQAPGTACANDDKENGGSLVTSTPRGIGKQNFENSLESDLAQHLGPSYLDLGVIQEATSIHDGRCDSPASCFAQSRRASEERAYTPILEFSFADGKYPSLPEDDTPSRSLNLQRLSEENICHSSFSNLLSVFFQTFCHGKKSLQEQVRQVLRDHGMTSEESSDSYLTLDGLIEWVKSKCVDSVRGIWKAILACGYDLDFKRSTYIFPYEVLEDHKNWSMAKDKLLVSFVNDQCRAISTSPSRLMPDEINMVEDDLVSEQYNQLQGIPLLSVRSRFAFLKSLNQTMEKLLLPMSDLRVADTHHSSTAALLKQASGFMFYDIKMAFLKRMLDHSDHRGSSPMSPEISLDPLETLEADKVSSSGPQFFQAARYLSTVSSAGLRVKVATGGDPTFPLRVQLRGEQVLGSGGSFRHFMWLMARELQGQHVNLLIPCPSTAANRNKGMLILKPGKMTYSEEKSLVFFGQLLGIALRSDIPFAVDLMPAFWKSLLVLPIDPKNDLHDTDILTYNYIRRFSEVQSREEFTTLCYEADLCPYRFVYTSLNGEEVELCPEGANKPVTWENHRLYVDAIRELRLKELRCTSRMAAIRCGLYSVVPPHALSVMLPSDLQIRTCGLPTVDLDFLKAHTTYVAGIKETDAHIEFFWNALESFSQDQLRKFVKFACNQERLPSTCTCQKGHPSTVDVHVPPYPMKIGPPDGTGRSDVRYIRVETCMFMVKLPRYSTQEITTQKLLYAINCREDPLTDI